MCYHITVKFGALWVGQPSLIEKIVWSSFIYHGHELTIFSYDDLTGVPEGIHIADANDIVSKEKIFYSPSPNKTGKSISAFADYFRYKMISKTGMCWTDSDALCLSNFFTDEEYFFAHDVSAGSDWVANGTIVAPKDSELINFLVESVEEIMVTQSMDNLKWGTLGPSLLAKGVDKFDLRSFVVDTKYLHPIGFHEVALLFDKTKTNLIKERAKDSASIHLFNAVILDKGIDKNALPKDCYLYQKAKEFSLI